MARKHWAIVIVVFAAATAYCTLPLPQYWSSKVMLDAGDSLFTSWTMEHTIRSLIHHPSQLFDGRMYYPRPYTFAWSDNLFAFTPLYGLAWGLSKSSVLAINISSFTWYFATSMMSFVLLRKLLSDWRAAFVAAFMFSFSLVRTSSIFHFQLNGMFFFLLGLFFLIRYFEQPRRRDAVFVALSVAGMFWTATYYFVLFLLVAAIFILWWLVLARRDRVGRKQVVDALIAIGVMGLTIGPTLIPYLQARHNINTVRPDRVLEVPAFRDFFHAPDSAFYRLVGGATIGDTARLYIGIITLAFVIVGTVALIRSRDRLPEMRARHYLLPFCTSAAVALLMMQGGERGLLSMPFRIVRKVLPGMASIRELTRFWVYPEFVLCVIAGIGVVWLFKKYPRKVNALVVVLLVLLSAELLVRGAQPTTDLNSNARTVNRALAKLPTGVVAEFPTPAYPWSNYANVARQLRGLDDNQPRFVGYTGIDPPELLERMAIVANIPHPGAVARLQQYGVRYIVLFGGKECDGKLTPEQLNETANALAKLPGTQVKWFGNDVLVILPEKLVATPTTIHKPPVDTGVRCDSY